MTTAQPSRFKPLALVLAILAVNLVSLWRMGPIQANANAHMLEEEQTTLIFLLAGCALYGMYLLMQSFRGSGRANARPNSLLLALLSGGFFVSSLLWLLTIGRIDCMECATTDAKAPTHVGSTTR